MKNSISIFTTNQLQKHWGFENRKNTHVIFNGVKKIITESRQSRPIFTIGIVGLVIPAKNQIEAIEILKLVRNLSKEPQLKIFGNCDSKYKMMIEAEIEKYNLQENVFFMGYESNQSQLFSQCDVLLSCSEFEGFGRTLIEAMSCGVPVIAKKKGGPTEIITHFEDGFLYNNPEEAAEYIRKIISDNSLKATIISNATNKFNLKFDEEIYKNRLLRIFRNGE